MKKLSQNQLTGQRGELLVADRTLAMGFAFDGRNRLETGIDGFLELRDQQTGQTLARWIGAQVKTTDAGDYVHEDDNGFQYLLKPNDLDYWRGSNRHHAFVPRFHRIGDEWYLSVIPTFVFTRDGYRSHFNSGALIAGKKKKERNGAVRGQFVMWRHLLIQSGTASNDLLTDGPERVALLKFEALDSIMMPLAVPEEAWRHDDPNAANMVETERLF